MPEGPEPLPARSYQLSVRTEIGVAQMGQLSWCSRDPQSFWQSIEAGPSDWKLKELQTELKWGRRAKSDVASVDQKN